MRIVLIGAGRLATNLGRALRQAGHDLLAVYSLHRHNAERLAAVAGGYATDDLSALPAEADAFIVSVKDACLRGLIPALTGGRRGQLFLHTAGSMPLSVFEGYAERCGVLYPMQTFSKEREADFSDLPLFIEGSDPLIRQLAESLSHQVYPLSTPDRRQLHLAAVFACNFANHCYTLAAGILERHGLPFSVMLPLIDETARKVHQLHPADAQTGPAVRYDENVIRMQASMLDGLARDIYERMSLSIHQQATHYDSIRLTEDQGHRV